MKKLRLTHSGILKATVILALISGTGACASLNNENDAQQNCNCTAQTKSGEPAKLGKQRLILSEGYSLLHRDATRLDLSDLLLLVKSESDSVKDIVKDVAAFAGEVKDDLERLAKDYPGVRVDIDALPEMEKRKRSAIAKSRAMEFAPGIGRGGRDYERVLLISLLNGINHERHMCKVLAQEETDANLKQFLLDTEKGYDRLYARIETLLDDEYFK